jgi:hypothetical protein
LQKLIEFANSYHSISEAERIKFLATLDADPKRKEKVCESIVFIIDNADSIEKSQLLGSLFNQCVLNNIEFDVFRRLANAINSAYLDDVIALLNGSRDKDLLILLAPSGLTQIAGTSVAPAGVGVSLNRFELSQYGKMLVELCPR